jgi:AcrR family transcriptional regulator
MSTPNRRKTPVPEAREGRARQKLRTRRQILAAASSLISTGQTPTVAEAADAAAVSRRTAYRYFPTQAKLLTEAALEGLRLPMATAIAEKFGDERPRDVEARLRTVVENMQSLAISHESLLRTMIHQTVLERTPAGQPRRGTRRIEWFELAVEPLRARLGAKAYNRLVSALTLCGGIEALLVLRDIRGLSERDAIEVSQWAARAMLRQSLSELEEAERPAGGKNRRETGSAMTQRRRRRK